LATNDLDADLVIDATGRSSQAGAWLTAAAGAPIESCHRCGFSYLTRHYRLHPGRAFPSVQLPIVATLDYADVVAFPADNGIFSLSATPRESGYWTATHSIASCEPSRSWRVGSRPHTRSTGRSAMSGFLNRRRLVDGAEPLVAGFLLAGDSALGTSPTLGRDVSLAFVQAQQIARWLEYATPADAECQARTLAGAAPRCLVRISSGGRRRAEEQVVRVAADQVFNLFIEPGELLRNRQVLRCINAYLSRRPAGEARSEGPPRKEFERILTS
jgi:hypothetical protein